MTATLAPTLEGIATEATLSELMEGLGRQAEKDLAGHDSQIRNVLKHFPALAAIVRREIANLGVSRPFDAIQQMVPNAYPASYRLRDIAEQAIQLGQLLDLPVEGTLAFIENRLAADVSIGAEGKFAVPWHQHLSGTFFNRFRDPRSRYCAVVRHLVEILGKKRGLEIDPDMTITPDQIFIAPETAEALDAVADDQEGNPILVIDGQFGRQHGGDSAKGSIARFMENEFHLDLVCVTATLLTHPERLVNGRNLTVGCGGNQIVTDGNGPRRTVCFSYLKREKTLSLELCLFGGGSGQSGWATGFKPEMV